MRHVLSQQDRESLREEIEKTLRATPEQRLRHLSSLQRLYRMALKGRRARKVDVRRFEKRFDALEY